VRQALGQLRVAGKQRARGVQHRHRAQIHGERAEPCHDSAGSKRGSRHRGPSNPFVGRGRDNAPVTFTRIAWLVTLLACLVTCVAMLLSGYQGYAALVFAVGLCAAINLR
jgi:hypothetical protein